MRARWMATAAGCGSAAALLCGCPQVQPNDTAPPMAAATSIPTAAWSARGADYPPVPMAPGGPHTATGLNPFLAPPSAEPPPTPAPDEPVPIPEPLEPPEDPSTDPGGTPL